MTDRPGQKCIESLRLEKYENEREVTSNCGNFSFLGSHDRNGNKKYGGQVIVEPEFAHYEDPM